MQPVTKTFTLPLSHEDFQLIRARAQRERANVAVQLWASMTGSFKRAARRIGAARHAAKPSTAAIPCLHTAG